MAQIPQLTSTTTLGSADETILRQGTTDKRISLELANILAWAKREGYIHQGEYQSGVAYSSTEQFYLFNSEPYFVEGNVSLPYTTTISSPEDDSNLYIKNEAYFLSKTHGINHLSNHNFLVQSPDSITHPSTTPTDYVAGTQIFSGVFVGTDITGLTYINGRISFLSGDFYLTIPNTGGLEYVNQFTASVADFDGKPRTRGVSFALVGDNYRVTVDVDALEDESAALTPLGSVKFEQGSVATGHAVSEGITTSTLSSYAEITYKASGGNSAVENMIAGVPVAASVGDHCKTGRGLWIRTSDSAGDISDFTPQGAVYSRDSQVINAFASVTAQKIEEFWEYAANNSVQAVMCGDTFIVDDWRPTAFNEILQVPSNSDIHFELGSLIKRAPITSLITFNRIVEIRRKENITISGLMHIDGSYEPGVTNPAYYNEHNHNLFLFASHNVNIESLKSDNAMGDGGGFSGQNNLAESEFSDNVTIGKFSATTSGRKCLVIEAVRGLVIDHAVLDNTNGNVDGTGGNCIDYEPFNIDANGFELNATIKYLETKGAGDFTTGTTEEIARKFDLNINRYYMTMIPTAIPQPALIAFAVSCNVGYIKIDASDVTVNSLVAFSHSSLWDIGEMNIICGSVSSNIVEVSAVGAESPQVNINKLRVENVNGRPFFVTSAKVNINDCELIAEDSATQSQSVIRSVSGNGNLDFHIGLLKCENIGQPSSGMFQIDNTGGSIGKRIIFDSIQIDDDRASPSINMFSVVAAEQRNILTVRSINSPFPEVTSGIWYRRSGGINNKSEFVYTASPENNIPAVPGSTCQSGDGNLYRKSTGSGNTGWIAV